VLKRLLSFLPRLWTNWLTLTGSIITTVAGCTIVLAVAAETVSPSPNPYTSAVAFLAMPMAFLFGLVLIPIGFAWERIKIRKRGGERIEDPIQAAFRTAMQDKVSRRRILFVGFMTLFNLLIVGAAGQRALGFMDSVEFCGTMCHTVMEPEYSAYLRSPHSRVKCVECHIGPGASWAVKAKISGLRQVWAVLVDSFERPVPAPVQELRPARDTCEQCHWPAKFHGNRVAFKTHFGDDEANTPKITALLLKVGGEDPRTGEFHGIHWHVSPDVEVRFDVLDDKREQVGKVAWYKKGELASEYLPAKQAGEVREVRSMDCVDCHNRPTHIYDASPGAAVDRMFAEGKLDVMIPHLKAEAVKVITRTDIPRDQAAQTLATELQAVYARDHADRKVAPERLAAAAEVLAAVYRENVFPDMKIGWDTYPSHLGHRGEEVDTRGCFRCHDDKHATADGKTLSQDCDICHEVLHEDESLDELPESLRALLALKPFQKPGPVDPGAGDKTGTDPDDSGSDDEPASDTKSDPTPAPAGDPTPAPAPSD
jgi:nitrate/TMAO reductase-like tetraheme cytochrome c subunit